MCAALLLSLLLFQLPPQTPPAAPAAPAASEIIADVRVHGNYTTPDAEVLRLAGITIGAPFETDSLQRITKRLRDSGRFQEVEVRKRYRSLTDTQQVVLVVIVQEHPSASPDPTVGLGNPVLGSFRRLQERLQLLPILNYSDGYGFTYGGRTSFANVLGKESRISIPLTWGASRRAALEADKTFGAGLVTRVEGGAAIAVRENPFFREDDGRKQVWGRVERELVPRLKLAGQLGVTHVNFELPNVAPLHDTFATYGTDLTLDTRRDAIFPRDAIFANVGWDALNFTGDAATVHRTHADVRGYVGLIGQSVLTVRARLDSAGGPVPPYEQLLLGGSSSLRGFRTGAFIGDNRALAGAEVRVPLSSPLGISRAGISLFADSGAVYDHGVHLRDATFHHGAGAGVFWLAPFLQLNLDVAYGFGNRLRVHFTSGFTF